MRAYVGTRQRVLFALVAVAIGAGRAHASTAMTVVPAARAVVVAQDRSEGEGAGRSRVDATARAQIGTDTHLPEERAGMLACAARGPRDRPRAVSTTAWQASWSTLETTRARATAVAYLEYALALFQRRAGIPTNHTTAPPHQDS